MRVLKRNPWLASLGVLLVALAVFARAAWADVTADQSASILIFPKVIADGTRDTLIQISNTTNGVVFAHCIYVDASLETPSLPPGPDNRPRCQERDFFIRLTKQQPTIWRASTGRLLNLNDGTCTSNGCKCVTVNVDGLLRQNCPGLDPGPVPVAGSPFFQGELKCVQIDETNTPVSGNALKGEAIIEGPNGIISEYNAIGIVGKSVNGDGVLQLDNVEYNACPERLTLSHLTQGGNDPVLDEFGVSAPVETELTIAPCTENFVETGNPTQLTVTVFTWDEFESFASTTVNVDCWLNTRLTDIDSPTDPDSSIFSTAVRGSTVMKTVLLPNPAAGQGILALGEEFRVINGTRTGSAAMNVHVAGSRANGDTITLEPAGTCCQIGNPGNCTGQACFDDSDCGAGFECL